MVLSKEKKLYIKGILYNSLAQAIIRLVAPEESNITPRIFLFLFIVTSNALSSYYIAVSVLSFLDYEVITTSRTIYEMPTQFPKITICNRNRFQTKYAFDLLHNITKNMNTNIKVFSSNEMKDVDLKIVNELLDNIKYRADGMIRNNFSNEDKQQLGHSLEDILMNCKFDDIACSSKDFNWTYDSYYGNCYEFNSEKDDKSRRKVSSVAGAINGLRLKLYTNYHENLSYLNSNNGGSGVVIKIDNSSFLKDHKLNAIQISSGTYTHVEISRSFNFMLPKPYSSCVLDEQMTSNKFYILITKSGYIYTQELCLTQCQQNIILKECNCSDSLILSLFDVKSCETESEIDCTKIYSVINSQKDSYKLCLESCPLECHRVEYRTSLTSTNLMGEYYVEFIKRKENLSKDFLSREIDTNLARESFVRLNIYYESLSYTHLSESPKIDYFSLIGFVGGILGLFLGVNVISICELTEVLIEIYLLQKKLKTKQKVKNYNFKTVTQRSYFKNGSISVIHPKI
jgi:hypothetical protein